MLEIKEVCRFCSEDSISCNHCNLTGTYVRWILSSPLNVFYSHEILEAIDTAEFGALNNKQKAQVQLVLSCGFVDLNEDKAGKIYLWDLFGTESTTVANLTALLK